MNIYRDPKDKRVFVAQPNGGMKLNFGHPIAWVILACTTVIPFTIVAVVTIAVLI